MSITHIITGRLRKKFKKPLGRLLRGEPNETAKKLRDMIFKDKPTSIVSVGDFVSKNLVENQIFPKISVMDNRVMREEIKPVQLEAESEIYVKNPPGTLTFEALAAVQKAFKANCSVKIIVDGEEDLLTLAAVLYAPENSFIVYGQPGEGLVVVRVTQRKRSEVARILKVMENAAKG